MSFIYVVGFGDTDAGNVVLAVIERRCQAIEAGRFDLASQDYLFTEATA